MTHPILAARLRAEDTPLYHQALEAASPDVAAAVRAIPIAKVIPAGVPITAGEIIAGPVRFDREWLHFEPPADTESEGAYLVGECSA